MGNMGQFGDTTLTKVFVGGLAWETQTEVLKEHFASYGEILEAAIISDKATGRSKGYGFVTFKEAEAARKACEDPTPVINGRRANCNLASLGARRPKGSPSATPAPLPHQPSGAGIAIPVTRTVTTPPPPARPGHWVYPPPLHGAPHPSAFPHQYHGGVPYYAAYGYPPSYVTDVGYSAKLGNCNVGGHYMQGGHFPQTPYPTQGGVLHPNGMLPFYPYYPYPHQQHPRSMGVATHFFPQTPATAHVATAPAIISKPATAMPPTAVRLAVEQVTG